MQPSPAPIRERARFRNAQVPTTNASTSARFNGRLAEELNPVHQPHGVEEQLEDGYSDELRRLETFMNDDFCDNDYDLDMGEDVSTSTP